MKLARVLLKYSKNLEHKNETEEKATLQTFFKFLVQRSWLDVVYRYTIIYLCMLSNCKDSDSSAELDSNFIKICGVLFEKPPLFVYHYNLMMRQFLPHFKPSPDAINDQETLASSSQKKSDDGFILENKIWMLKNMKA